ncbi:MAG TPA: PAS domain S-box protein [Sedimentisphaerales bacterium]|nr:PAS domain S-box protein [Sedimentisphaerales bacterium]HRV46286.1 PAS domain S-box protein [Sedimentisphaerales bacterium]
MDERRPNGVGDGHGWYRPVLAGVGLASACVLVWCGRCLPVGVVDGTHVLYVPAVLACLWFGWRGFAVAAVAAACVATTHFTGGTVDAAIPSDVLRSLILVLVSAVVAGLKEGHLRAQRDLRQLRSRPSRDCPMERPDAGDAAGASKCFPAFRPTDAVRIDSENNTGWNLLRTLIDNLPDAIYVKDRQGRFVLGNPPALRQKGVTSVEGIVGKTDYDFDPKDVAERAARDEQELMSGSRPIMNHERCVLDASCGTKSWYLTTKVPLRNEQGEIIGLVGIGRDITDRRRAEEAYRTLVDHSLQGLVVIQDERIVFANRAMSRISGYTVEEILAKSPAEVWDFIHPEDRQRVVANYHARLDGEPLPENYEFQIVRKDGTVRWVELHACRIEYRGRPAIHAACADVTERVLAQRALMQSESQTHALLDAIPDLIFRLGRDGVVRDCRAAKRQVLFFPPDELVGKTVAEVLPEPVSRSLTELIERTLETGQIQTLEYQLQTPMGICDEECRLVACGPHEVIAIVRDISVRKRAEHLSRITHDLAVRLNTVGEVRKGARLCLEAAIEASQADCGGVYLVEDTSGAMKLLTHCGTSDRLTPNVLSIGSSSAQMRLLAQGKPVYYGADERHMPLSPAQRKAELSSYAALPIRNEHALVGVLVVASNRCDAVPRQARPALETIAAQMGTTLARLRAEEALIASERNYREIFNAANEAIFVQDPDAGTILDVNRSGLDMFGYSYEELQRMNVGDLRAEPLFDRAGTTRKWFTKAVQEGPQVVEWLCRRKDRSCFWAEVNLKQARIGGCDRILAVARDISERVQAARAAENHRVELTRAWHANTLGEMASGLAHELNQPLCAIVNYAGGCLRLAGREPFDRKTLCDSIAQIAEQAERAAGIIKRIRGLVAKREPRRTSLDLRDALNEAMSTVETEIARLGITVVRDLAEDLPIVRADAVGVQQVVLNLVRNAMDAMSGNRVPLRRLTLSARAVKNGEEVEVAVADTGQGLSSQLIERVFDSFFTTKNKGLGIGLSLSRRIIEAHGGRLWVRSDPGSGAVFRFTLPAEGVEHEQREAHGVCRR